MKYCNECGSELVEREKEHEGMFPYCETCHEFRFPMFNTAVSMIILNPDQTKILMIQQYGNPYNILVAGYVDKGECLEEAIIREVKEEIGLNVIKTLYNKSEYFPKSNTVICNFICMADSEDLSGVSDWEVDQAKWFLQAEVLNEVKPNSLAKRFLEAYFQKVKYQKFSMFD